MKRSICAGVSCRKPRTETGGEKVYEKLIGCAGVNLPTVLFYLCEEAQERLAEKAPDYKKVDSDRLMDAIADKLEDSNDANSFYVDMVLGIELEVLFNQELGFKKINVASFDTRYGDGAGESAVQKAKVAWLQVQVAEKPKLCGSVKRTLLSCFVLLASFAFAETEVVDGIEWAFKKFSPDGKLYYSLLSSPAIPRSTMGDVVIPCHLGGRPVCLQYSDYGNGAFQYCEHITSIISVCPLNL